MQCSSWLEESLHAQTAPAQGIDLCSIKFILQVAVCPSVKAAQQLWARHKVKQRAAAWDRSEVRRLIVCRICWLAASFILHLTSSSCAGLSLHLHLCGCVCILQVITPLLRILEKMHNMMLLHRDIKPENIFLTGMGKFKLGDFGLAIRFDKELAFSRSGTLDYMAPEVRGACAGVLIRLAVRYLTGLPCCRTQQGTLRMSAGKSHKLCAASNSRTKLFC